MTRGHDPAIAGRPGVTPVGTIGGELELPIALSFFIGTSRRGGGLDCAQSVRPSILNGGGGFWFLRNKFD